MHSYYEFKKNRDSVNKTLEYVTCHAWHLCWEEDVGTAKGKQKFQICLLEKYFMLMETSKAKGK